MVTVAFTGFTTASAFDILKTDKLSDDYKTHAVSMVPLVSKVNGVTISTNRRMGVTGRNYVHCRPVLR